MMAKRKQSPIIEAFISPYYPDVVCWRIRDARERLAGIKLNAEQVKRVRKALMEIHSGLTALGSLARELNPPEPPSDAEMNEVLGL